MAAALERLGDAQPWLKSTIRDDVRPIAFLLPESLQIFAAHLAVPNAASRR